MIKVNNFENFDCRDRIYTSRSISVKNDDDSKKDINSDKIYSKAMHSIGLSMVKSDKDALSEINSYGKKIREKEESGKVSLSRNPLWDCDIPYQENNYYRMIGEGGYSDIKENGIIRAKQNTKQNYCRSYFEKGRANSIYSRKGGANYILEIPSDCKNIINEPNSYPAMEPVKSDEIKFRIWHLTDDKHYEIVSDTINDVITRHPEYRFHK